MSFILKRRSRDQGRLGRQKTQKSLFLIVGKAYYETGGVFEEVDYQYGTPRFMRVYREDGTLADEKGFFDKEVIKRIVG